jgi:TPR repeat protein
VPNNEENRLYASKVNQIMSYMSTSLEDKFNYIFTKANILRNHLHTNDPNLIEAYSTLGSIYRFQDDVDKALFYYEKSAYFN